MPIEDFFMKEDEEKVLVDMQRIYSRLSNSDNILFGNDRSIEYNKRLLMGEVEKFFDEMINLYYKKLDNDTINQIGGMYK